MYFHLSYCTLALQFLYNDATKQKPSKFPELNDLEEHKWKSLKPDRRNQIIIGFSSGNYLEDPTKKKKKYKKQ